MRAPAVAALALVAAAAGYLAGRAGVFEGVRGSAPRGAVEPAARKSLPVERLVALEEREARMSGIEAENARIRAELESLRPPPEPEAQELPPGARRPDGSIVGGGRWSKQFVQTATGFIELMLGQFLAEAKLTPEQEKSLRGEMRLRIVDAMQLSADFTNGDLTGDEVYEKMLGIYEEAGDSLRNLLDARQFEVYGAYEGRVKTQIRDQLVASEMAGLRSELSLDTMQELAVKAIVDERWRRVQEAVPTAIPNILFKAIRRETDALIYRETAAQIRDLLRPEQASAFDRIETSAPEAPYTYRNMLLPKGP